MTSSTILSLRGIRKSYGPIDVLHGFDIDIKAGEVVALLGENGAGKSTVSNIISGTVQPSGGTMTWLGAPYAPSTPRAAMDAGVGMIHQELKLLPQLSIAENVFVGRYLTKGGMIDRAAMEIRASQGLQRLGLSLPPTQLVAGLSTGNQQLIEIAKALTLNARLLILDEPTAALGGDETQLLFRQIERLKADGVGIIYISHRLEEIRQIADRIVVMRDGAKVQEFDRGDVPVRSIVEAMVGRSLERMFPAIPTPTPDVALEVRGLCAPNGTFRDVSFSVHKGEVFGIAGLMGAGRTELVRAMTGADSIARGQILLDGQVLRLRAPIDSIRAGMVLVPEDRKQQGVVLTHSIAENIGYASLKDVGLRGWITARRLRDFANRFIAQFGVKGRAEQNAGELSGGNQQKVVLAKWLARNPKIVVLDEPTRGIDVGARSSIYELIMDLARSGVAVVVVSSDLEEVLGVSNRVMVMAKGRQAGILNRADANEISVMELATT